MYKYLLLSIIACTLILLAAACTDDTASPNDDDDSASSSTTSSSSAGTSSSASTSSSSASSSSSTAAWLPAGLTKTFEDEFNSTIDAAWGDVPAVGGNIAVSEATAGGVYRIEYSQGDHLMGNIMWVPIGHTGDAEIIWHIKGIINEEFKAQDYEWYVHLFGGGNVARVGFWYGGCFDMRATGGDFITNGWWNDPGRVDYSVCANPKTQDAVFKATFDGASQTMCAWAWTNNQGWHQLVDPWDWDTNYEGGFQMWFTGPTSFYTNAAGATDNCVMEVESVSVWQN